MKCNTDVEIAVNGWPQFDCTSIRLRDHIGLVGDVVVLYYIYIVRTVIIVLNTVCCKNV